MLKIHSGYLSKHNWHLDFRLSEIRKQSQMVVSLGSSQVLRWLTKLQGRENDDFRATEIKKEIKSIKKLENTYENKQKISKLYNELYQKQFQQDYLMIIKKHAKINLASLLIMVIGKKLLLMCAFLELLDLLKRVLSCL